MANSAAIITAEDVGAYKPAENHFRALDNTLAGLGVDHTELLHVAQSLFHDHVPAKREGLPSVWINRRHDPSRIKWSQANGRTHGRTRCPVPGEAVNHQVDLGNRDARTCGLGRAACAVPLDA